MKVWDAVRGLLVRAFVVTVELADGLPRVHVQVRRGRPDVLPLYSTYGLSVWPKDGAEAVIAKLGADGANGIVLNVTDRRFLLTLGAKGEVALHDDQGQKVHIKRDRIVIEADTIELGEGAAEAVIKGSAFQTLFNGHKHTGGTAAGLTGTPTPDSLMSASHVSSKVKTE